LTAEDPAAHGDSLTLPDLASRAMRGSVVAASDEFFAEKENLIKPGPAVFSPSTFGHKGQVYDGWETRRRRGPDGGVARLRLHGALTPEGLAEARRRWAETAP
jgi:allantoicase